VNRDWIVSIINEVSKRYSSLGVQFSNKKQLYGQPGQVSKNIVSILKKEFDNGDANFYPWLHQRLGLWRESQAPGYL
jgi:UDP-N-acetylglucosamine 2-epimerase (non-hydrolysing)